MEMRMAAGSYLVVGVLVASGVLIWDRVVDPDGGFVEWARLWPAMVLMWPAVVFAAAVVVAMWVWDRVA